MKLAALFSGGKDSTYSIYKCKQDGYEINCLATLFPLSSGSWLFHHPNIKLTRLQGKSIGIPHISIDSKSSEPEYEVQRLEKILHMGKSDYPFEGLVHGGILSEFQKKRFQLVCSKLNLKLISPIWKKNQKQYMKTLIECKFRFIITSVTTEGLDESWLGREITAENLPELETLSEKYGFNLNFEGGEAETFVIDCPLFSHPIKIEKSRTEWDGYRGRFEILDAKLDYNAR